MAGALTVDTLNSGTGVLATQNGMTGIAKAWVRFAGGNPPVVSKSFNVSSVTYNTTGQYTINFTTAMSGTTYSQFISTGLNTAQTGGLLGLMFATTTPPYYTAPTTTSCTCAFLLFNGSLFQDPYVATVAIFD
jgi:hypothetical protein